MATPTRSDTSRDQNPWAAGASVFAGVTMAIVGLFQFMEGLVAVINGKKFFVTTPDYVFQFNATSWGWIHMLLGAIVAATGVFIFTGSIIARSLGIAVAGLSAVANFLWLPYYPFWSIVIIALDVFVIWGLASTSLGD